MTGAWERINDQKDKEEYWLKPRNKPVLNPEEQLSFTNFQIKWIGDQPYAGSIMGFVYSEELSNGSSSMNQINLSGRVKQGDHHE
ncbi:hypothetical protein MUN89_04535 [Halobacillus salinarum]|uniref:Uncharacterized protein n=1 Tax=Halobacillus salinarum TaxID=2932257 RepID=A0ABY4ESV2_9BACI|nr:hypothetical protein [Halobacillus salinarum]UOQ45221.1 hypothetical protein MUN89_04535 [Halobacillus salinarum]